MSETPTSNNKKKGSVLVVGGGIGGMQSALDLADSGFKVYMLERESSIGGTMCMLDKTFPTGDCAMCMLSPKMVDTGRHLNIELITNAALTGLEGNEGNFTAYITKKARYIDLTKCTGCAACTEVCPVRSDSEFEQNLAQRTAIHRRYAQAVPGAVIIDKQGISPCRIQCPAETNAHAYVSLIARGKHAEALELVRTTNPFPASVGRVCTHPCETSCRRGDVDEPVSICSLKRFLTDYEDSHGGFALPQLPEQDLERVAIVGAGPAGLTAARDLALKGYRVTVFEKLPVAGGMLAVAIPEYRLPKDVLNRELDTILAHNIELRTGQGLGQDFTLDDLKSQGYKAVFLAIGTHRALKLRVPGEDDYDGVHDCIEFLRRVNLGEKVEVGKKVVVIGGGNAAIDSARTALRIGAGEVVIAYRRTHAEMPANSWEIEEAEREGVKIHTLAAPTKIMGEDGKVTGIECLRMELGEPDESGRRRPIPVEGTEFLIETDMVIAAISQEPEIEPVLEQGIATNRWNCIEVDEVTLATNIEGVFAGGDVVTGPSTVVEAIGMGGRAAESIDRYLRGEDIYVNRDRLANRKGYIKDIANVPTRPRKRMPQLQAEERKGNFAEVELGLSEEDAVEEASRCLNCAGCCECLLCVDACEAKAIAHEMEAEEHTEINVGAVILGPGLARYDPRVRGELGFGRWPNVVTSIQFERILSASGPYQGTVQRPSDNTHPKKIAWIQCVGSRDSHNANPWCSSVCCMYATKQSVIAKEHDPDIEPTIFYMEMRAFGKDFDKYVERAKNEYNVRYQRAMISGVREDPGTGDLVLRYAREDGELIEELFNMVVLSVGFEPHKDIDMLARSCGIASTDYGFAETSHFTPVETTRPGVFVTGTYQAPKDIPETVMQGSAVAGKAMALLGEVRGTETIAKELPPERDVTGEDPRIGVFVCSCGINIASTVDVHKLVEQIGQEPGVVYAENLLYACSQDSQEKIKGLINKEELNRVVVASCTPRTHTPLFQDTIRDAGLNKYLFELADIREQCSWCHMGMRKEATEKALQLVKMNVAKARRLEPVQNDVVDVTPVALVIGGGVAGMTAALSLGDQGFEVHLVEKETELGGLAKNVYRTLDGSDVQSFVHAKAAEVKGHPEIRVHTAAEVKGTDGFVGNFKTTLTDGTTFEHGAIVIATGGVEYEPTEYLYGGSDLVITQRELEKRLAAGDGPKPGESYVMIQCVGSREEPYQYCSRICCQDAIKNAIAIKEKSPGAQVFILYRDIRTYGLREQYYAKARDMGVIFIRYEPERKPELEETAQKIKVKVFDYMLNKDVAFDADYVVLSTGLRPHPTTDAIGEMYKLTRNPDGYFLEAHVKLRPVDFPSEGIFVCGLAHAPKNLDETISQALAAAGRAGVVLSHEKREVSGTISKHNRDICMSCLSCFRVCPFDSPYIDEDGRISHNEVKCMGCGICAGICPAKAFQVNNFRDEQIVAMIDSLAHSSGA
jgi:heterodisulfide reductase subunit A-like polyferredoxin